MTRLPRRTRGGFSLLELVLTLAMMAMLTLTLYMSMSIGMKARDQVERTVGQSRSALVAADLIRQDFEAVLAPTGLLAGPFYGSSQGGVGAQTAELSFRCIGRDPGLAVDDPLAEGMRQVELVMAPDPVRSGQQVLVRRVWRNLLAQVQEEPEEEILCRDVRSFGVRFWDGAAWQETWDSTTLGNVLPLAVEITLDTATPGRAGEAPKVYRVTRYLPLACGKLADETTDPTATGTGGQTP